MIFSKNSWKAAYAVWQRNVTIYRRSWKMSLLPNFFEPFLYLLGMGVGLGFYINDSINGISYLAFIAPGLVASAAMNGATFETTYNVFVRMVFDRIYNAYLGAPVRPRDIIFGEMLWAVTRAFIYGVIFLGILCLYRFLGYDLIQSWLVVFAPLVILLIGVLFAAIGLMFTCLIKSIDYYSYYFTLFLTPLFLFSGIFYPVTRFPHGETIAWFTPLYHGVRVMRALMLGNFGMSEWISVAWMFVVSAVLLSISPRFLKNDSPTNAPFQFMNTEEIKILYSLFLQKKMRNELWSHEAHFVVATCVLWDYGFETAMTMMRKLIKANNEHMGIANTDTSGYHETLTWFYLNQIHSVLQTSVPQTIDQAVDCVLASEITDKNYPLKFYSKDDLFSSHARKTHLPPALQSWFPASLQNAHIALLSTNEALHFEFKNVLNDTTTMHNLIPYFGTSVWTDEMIQSRSNKYQDLENRGEAKFYFVKSGPHPDVVGQCGFKNIDKQNQEAEFGIILHQSVWGQGVAKQCHLLCLEQAFENMGLKRITFVTDYTNSKMQKFFTKHGITRVENSTKEAYEYEILARDWPSVKTSLAA